MTRITVVSVKHFIRENLFWVFMIFIIGLGCQTTARLDDHGKQEGADVNIIATGEDIINILDKLKTLKPATTAAGTSAPYIAATIESNGHQLKIGTPPLGGTSDIDGGVIWVTVDQLQKMATLHRSGLIDEFILKRPIK